VDQGASRGNRINAPHRVGTGGETDCHLVEKVNADGSCVVLDKNSGQRVIVRLGVLAVSNQQTLVAVGPGSG
jgi:hypothetical protein